MEAHRQADGEIQLKDTGDVLIDKWEQQLADGETPDLWEAFSPRSKEILKEVRRKNKGSGIINFGDVQDYVQRQEAKLKPRPSWGHKSVFGDESD